jgi:hypothetical protein
MVADREEIETRGKPERKEGEKVDAKGREGGRRKKIRRK